MSQALMLKNIYPKGQAYGVWFSKIKPDENGNCFSIFEVIDLETGQVLPVNDHNKVIEELELAMEWGL